MRKPGAASRQWALLTKEIQRRVNPETIGVRVLSDTRENSASISLTTGVGPGKGKREDLHRLESRTVHSVANRGKQGHLDQTR
jgi:hypothetical protein